MTALISEETAQRIADELKRLADILEAQRARPLPKSWPPNDLAPNGGRCTICGRYHGRLLSACIPSQRVEP